MISVHNLITMHQLVEKITHIRILHHHHVLFLHRRQRKSLDQENLHNIVHTYFPHQFPEHVE